MKKMTLGNMLRGLTFVKDSNGNIVAQQSKNITICFLTTEDKFSLDARFENPTKATANTTGYGEVVLGNKTNKDVFVPQGMAYYTKKAKQDHGITKGVLLKAGQSVHTHDAVCVQSSQSGTGDISGDAPLAVLPQSVLEPMFHRINGGTYKGYKKLSNGRQEAVSRNDYGTTWHRIEELNENYGNRSGGGNMIEFIKKFDKELSESAVYFEVPDKTIGYVVFRDDEIVIVDKLPSFTMTKQLKRAYLKDRYGSLVLTAGKDGVKPKKRITEKFNELKAANKGKSTTELLKMANDELKKEQQNLIVDRFSELLIEEFKTETDKNNSTAYKLIGDNFSGHLVMEGDFCLGMSVVENRVNIKEATRKKLQLKNLSNQQSDFQF